MQGDWRDFWRIHGAFFLGLDEACIMVDAGVNIKTIGAENMKNNENVISDRCV